MAIEILDRKLAKEPLHFVLQPLLGGIAVLMILAFRGMLEYPVFAASLGASAFVAYTTPLADTSRPRNMIGGYVIGVICGSLCFVLAHSEAAIRLLRSPQNAEVIMGSLAVALAIFLMVATDTEHAPATGIALGFCLDTWDYGNVLFILGGIVVMSLVKRLLRPLLRDLT